MKKIPMLTDFSENADHVAKTVAKVVLLLKADILLYHTCYDRLIPLTYTGGPWWLKSSSFGRKKTPRNLAS